MGLAASKSPHLLSSLPRPHLRIIAALQANYSHSSIWHLGFNSLALLSFGESRAHPLL